MIINNLTISNLFIQQNVNYSICDICLIIILIMNKIKIVRLVISMILFMIFVNKNFVIMNYYLFMSNINLTIYNLFI